MKVRYKKTGDIVEIPDELFNTNDYEQISGNQTQSSSGNSLMDMILGLAGKTANFLAPTTTKMYQNAFKSLDKNVSKEEKLKLLEDYNTNKYKSAAELGSYLIPFGKGANVLTKVVAPALGMYGARSYAEDKPLTWGGAGASVLTAGILNKILGGGKGIEKTGKALQEKVLNPVVKATPKYSTEVNKMLQFADDLGLKGSARDQLDQLAPKFDEIENLIRKDLSTQKTEALYKTALKKFENRLNKSEYLSDLPGYKQAKDIFIKRLKGIFKSGSSSGTAIYNLKTELGDELKKTFSKDTLMPKEEVRMALFNSLKDTLDDLVPKIRSLNTKEHMMFEVSKGLVKNVGKGGLNIPLFGQQFGDTAQSMKDTSGKLLESGGGLLQKILSPFQSDIARNIGIQTGQRSIDSVFNPTPQNQSTGGNIDQTGINPNKQQEVQDVLNKILSSQGGVTQTKTSKNKFTEDLLLKILFNPDLDSDTKSLFLNFYKIQEDKNAEDKLSATEQSALDQANAGLSLLGTLKSKFGEIQQQGLTATGPGLGILGGVKGSVASLLQNSPQARAYEDAKSAFMSKISRAAGEKGVLTDQDIARIEKAIPNFYDTPETASEKWQLIESIMNSAIKAKSGSKTSTSNIDINVLMQLLGQ